LLRAGTLLSLVFITTIGSITGLEGMPAYWLLFTFAILLQASSSIGQSASRV
jgi:hypothetical protein